MAPSFSGFSRLYHDTIGADVSRISYQQQNFPVQDGELSVHLQLLNDAPRTLHFLHGNGFAVRSYDALLEGIVGQDNLMLQDAAGHGLSLAGEQFVGWERSSERFQALLMQLRAKHDWSSLIGIGHSFGGCMTLLMNAREANLFQKNILLDPALYPPKMIELLMTLDPEEKRRKSPLVRQTERRRTHWSSFEEVVDSLRGRGTFAGWQERCLRDYVQYSTHENGAGERELNCPPWLEAAVFGSSPLALWSSLERVVAPTFVLWGTNTLDMFQASYRLAQTLNPNLHFIEVQGDHCFMMQYPEETARLVRAIIDQGMEGVRALAHSDFIINFDG